MISFSKEQIFIVTGASSGIGEGIALLINSLGATVIAIGRNQERLLSLKSKSKNPDSLFLEQKDLTENISELPNYIRTLKDKYGKFTGLVCSAGMDMPSPLVALDLNNGKSLFDINYFAPIFLAKGFVDKRVNIGLGASIVFIASTAGVYPEKGQTYYAASKAALIAGAKSISKEISHRGLRCNCISPAFVDTPMYQKNKESIGTDLSNYALGIGKTSDLADMTAFLLSNKARWITGQNYILDGGCFG